MTNSSITPKNAGTRSEAASRAKMRRAEAGWADKLRARGWVAVGPDHVAALGRLVAEYAAAARCPVGDVWGALGMDTPDAR